MEDERKDNSAWDMGNLDTDSDILEFYKDSTVFITGATGFLGKLCLEKLLRTCPNLNKIYILIRPKKGKDTQKRFEELFSEPSFDPLKRKFPNFMQKILMVNGDVSLPDLGLNEGDMEKLIAQVDCVFHFAATVNFQEKLKSATYINVRAVRDILKLCRQMKKLRTFIYVSTAFSNCVRKDIDEKFYNPPISGDKLITLVNCLDDERLDTITPMILGDFPNTYTFTKCVAEDILRTDGKNLPVALYRPSIVTATVKEPIEGWTDNIYSSTGVLVWGIMGLLRVLQGKVDNKADLVPADYVVNSCLATAWDVATIKALNNNNETLDKQSEEENFGEEIPVYNFVSSPEQPLTWRGFRKLTRKNMAKIPSERTVWPFYMLITPSISMYLLAVFLLHTVPAYVIDFIAICMGKKPMLVKVYRKINKFANILAYFILNESNFSNNNIQSLWNRMKKHDRKLFEFSMKNFDWDKYFYAYTKGGRVYLLKDPLDTVPKGVIKYYKLMVAQYVLLAVIGYFLFKLAMLIGSFFWIICQLLQK